MLENIDIKASLFTLSVILFAGASLDFGLKTFGDSTLGLTAIAALWIGGCFLLMYVFGYLGKLK